MVMDSTYVDTGVRSGEMNGDKKQRGIEERGVEVAIQGGGEEKGCDYATERQKAETDLEAERENAATGLAVERENAVTTERKVFWSQRRREEEATRGGSGFLEMVEGGTTERA
ncbi:hypothetical protein PIB30_038569 [Stylosanthes scabra]|uniref:Uncharacterized protein n=1 Tax=Stylosanthes scabra TaxID=79078 RepID=A0ABU6ZB16_9FABA|nr:hypothetical protein [Stylosanthes scabra]